MYKRQGKGRFPESVFHGVFMCFRYKCFDFHIVLPLCIRNNFDPDFLAAEVKGVFVVIEEYVDLLAAYGSAAILDGPFAYAFYVKDSTCLLYTSYIPPSGSFLWYLKEFPSQWPGTK